MLAVGQQAPIIAPPIAIPLLPVPSQHAAPDAASSQKNEGAIVAEHREVPSHAPGLASDAPPARNSSAVAAKHHAEQHPHGQHADIGHAGTLPRLPGLVPRPLTLAQAAAEAITLAAYRKGSTDNLAALVVDLQPQWRTESTMRSNLGGVGQNAGVARGESSGGPELAGESADYTLPWHSTGLLVPQHGELSHEPQPSKGLGPCPLHNYLGIMQSLSSDQLALTEASFLHASRACN